MLRQLVTMIAAFGLATSAAAADRAPSPAARSECLAGNLDRVAVYVLFAAIIAAIVIATVDDGDSGDNPTSP